MENINSFYDKFMLFLNHYSIIGIAIGLLMAAKIGDLVKSLVEDVITPGILAPIFKKLKIEKLEDLSWNGILRGKFLARSIDFLIVAILIFIIIENLGISAPKV